MTIKPFRTGWAVYNERGHILHVFTSLIAARSWISDRA